MFACSERERERQREGQKFPFFCARNKLMTHYEIILFFQCEWIRDEKNECLVPVMFPDHTPPAPHVLLEMIQCNCATDTPYSWRSCSCTNAQLSCTKFCKCYGRTCFNSWTCFKSLIVQENSNNESEDKLRLEDWEWCLKMNL